ncbi:hypothetical protein H0H92_003791 [Tricholoma furcatifolium]|nr:hypothetical protein H0H92_003791 [Tricholoma furcatifolium]
MHHVYYRNRFTLVPFLDGFHQKVLRQWAEAETLRLRPHLASHRVPILYPPFFIASRSSALRPRALPCPSNTSKHKHNKPRVKQPLPKVDSRSSERWRLSSGRAPTNLPTSPSLASRPLAMPSLSVPHSLALAPAPVQSQAEADVQVQVWVVVVVGVDVDTGVRADAGVGATDVPSSDAIPTSAFTSSPQLHPQAHLKTTSPSPTA